MFDMDDYYLACIYEFFRICYCPQLERLFVQVTVTWMITLCPSAGKVSEEASVEKLLEAEAREDDKLSGASVPEEEASVNELPGANVAEAPEEDDISKEEALLEDNRLEEEGLEDDQSEEELLNNGI